MSNAMETRKVDTLSTRHHEELGNVILESTATYMVVRIARGYYAGKTIRFELATPKVRKGASIQDQMCPRGEW